MTSNEIREKLNSVIEDGEVILKRDEAGCMHISVDDMANLMSTIPLTKAGLTAFGGGYEVQAQIWFDAGLIPA